MTTKKYISSFISIRYAFYMPVLAMAVFACTFIYGMKGLQIFKVIGGGFGVSLAILMVFYYREKIVIGSQLKKIDRLNEFDDAVLLGETFFTETRMLSFYKGKLLLSDYSDLKDGSLAEDYKGKLLLTINTDNSSTVVELVTKEQVGRVAAFLCAKHPGMSFVGVDVKGAGTLLSIDPYRDEKTKA